MLLSRRRLPVAAGAALLFTVAACGGDADAEDAGQDGGEQGSVEIEDNNGTHTVATPPGSVVATDNRTFETLADWDVEITAGAVALMPEENPYTQDEDVVDLGNHREPDLEAVVAVEPDLIVNGQRFTQFQEDFASLAPDAVVLDLEPREGEPLDAELKRQTTALGEIFGKQAEAEELTGALDDAVARAEAAYDPAETVLAVNVSGGDIGYLAPTEGRALGPVFDVLGLTPALEVEGSDFDRGDDISVEAIADANPDWILVIDRDAPLSDPESEWVPAAEVIEGSPALAGVTAVQEGNIVYMPADAYLNEGIQTYTEFFGSFADALETD